MADEADTHSIMEDSTRTASNAQFTRGTMSHILQWLTVIGISLSIVNELCTLPWETPGWAILTRTIHAWLGLGALLWVLFRYKPGLILLIAWIVTSFPVIATDPSGNWTDPIWEANTTTWSSTRSNETTFEPYYSQLTRKGINFAPILVAVWFIIATRRHYFPVFPLASHQHQRWQRYCLLLIASIAIGITYYANRILTAPLVCWGTSQSMQFYYKDKLLGTHLLVLNEDLLKKVGLDHTQPKKNWGAPNHHYTPYSQGIYITDGKTWARIDTIEAAKNGRHYSKTETPWGQRTMVVRRNHNSPHDWILEFAPTYNTDFKITVTPNQPTALPSESISLNVQIDPLHNRVELAEAKMTVIFRDLNPNGDDLKRYPNRGHTIRTPAGIHDLKDGVAEFTIEVDAPEQEGDYSIYIPSIWFYDENGDYLEPIRKARQSDQSLITIKASDA